VFSRPFVSFRLRKKGSKVIISKMKFHLSDYFCESCCNVMLVTVVSSRQRVILGCGKCRINSAEVLSEYHKYLRTCACLDWIRSGDEANNCELFELTVAHSLNHSWSGRSVLGDSPPLRYLVGGLGVYVNSYRGGSLKSYVDPCLRNLEDKLLSWRFPLQKSLLDAYCLPLAVLSRKSRSTVVVCRLILMMIGHCFARASSSSDLLDLLVYSAPAGLKHEVE